MFKCFSLFSPLEVNAAKKVNLLLLLSLLLLSVCFSGFEIFKYSICIYCAFTFCFLSLFAIFFPSSDFYFSSFHFPHNPFLSQFPFSKKKSLLPSAPPTSRAVQKAPPPSLPFRLLFFVHWKKNKHKRLYVCVCLSEKKEQEENETNRNTKSKTHAHHFDTIDSRRKNVKNTSQRPRPFASLLQGRTIVCVREKVSERKSKRPTEPNQTAAPGLKWKTKLRERRKHDSCLFFCWFFLDRTTINYDFNK